MSAESAPSIVARIDALLPQTQCTRCGYSGCRPYAAAIAGGEAQINQCPPGGGATIQALAELLNRAFLPMNPANGTESPPQVAWIDESRCIGCARCLAPCPVDAILGAAKFMHTVLAERCTGCELNAPQPRSIRGPYRALATANTGAAARTGGEEGIRVASRLGAAVKGQS